MKILCNIISIALFPFSIYSQIIFKNEITDLNPSLSNPYTNGQIVDPNLSVSGIGRGSGINGNTGANRYNARDWNLIALDTNDYFEFILTPNNGYRMTLSSLEFKAQVSAVAGPTFFALRSSLDGYVANISTPLILATGTEITPTPIDLSSPQFQDLTTAIHFRLYAWGGSSTTGTFSINEFAFHGSLKCDVPVPQIQSVMQPDCSSPTGSVTLTNLPNGTWNLFQNDVLILSNGTGNSTTVSSLNAGTHQFKLGNNYCLSNASNNVSIISNTTTWDGNSWSNGTPNGTNHLVFEGNYTSTSPLECCSCKIHSGDVIFQSNHTLKITNNLSVTGGKLTFNNQASLVQINDNATNFGTIHYQRLTTPVSNLDYTYWSSPVTGFTIGSVSPNTLSGKWYSYNATVDNWKQESASSIMDKGIGYIIRGPEQNKAPNSPSTHLATFIGTPNNGNINVPIVGNNRSNLVGNPYPSAIDADAFIQANTAFIDGTLYFWTHNTSIQLASNITNGSAGTGKYAYTSDDYATYNLSGGVAAIQTPNVSGGTNTNIPNGTIGAGQGFFITGITSGNLIFNNSMRLDSGGNFMDNSQFFKFQSTSKNKTPDKNRIWLNLTNTEGAFKQILVGYIKGATDEYDKNFDGITFDSNPYLDFYSLVENKKLVIQGKALPYLDHDKIALGFRTAIAGEFIISLPQSDGDFISKPVYIEDKQNQITHNLKDGAYTFTTEKGIFDNRFLLHHNTPNLSETIIKKESQPIIIYTKNSSIVLNSAKENIKEVSLLDVAGTLLLNKKNIHSHSYSCSELIPKNQLLIAKIKLANRQTITKKIMF
ncbi:T9SS sorting signal type C domain-containing protein [Flavobacterium sp. UMI-01]|uniref:T9SS sorting signal type C domain-containing protein n=1 Tax=Flavobacterium sp. UMI-01 TaxID=1441053 RepID=UPI001C7D008B|nr:T9SS sorting signal type C domain-containing protein [Flavobacterium sp. UMI-01]GIZ09920.1 hypothetical protein FUMI01_26460 [Flavobacterium sp. UMI-01]